MKRLHFCLVHPISKPIVFVISLLPILFLIYGVFTDSLGANPAEVLIRSTGDWTIRFLCATLLLSPLKYLTGISSWIRFRRMLGVFTFFYALMHFLSYAWLDMAFDLVVIINDIIKRPFILAGSLALLGLLILASTSFNKAIQWLGGKRWIMLHKLVYMIALLSLIHFFWMRSGKNDFIEPLVYTFIVALLFFIRVWEKIIKKNKA